VWADGGTVLGDLHVKLLVGEACPGVLEGGSVGRSDVKINAVGATIYDGWGSGGG
jgi:hypothetical protein